MCLLVPEKKRVWMSPNQASAESQLSVNLPGGPGLLSASSRLSLRQCGVSSRQRRTRGVTLAAEDEQLPHLRQIGTLPPPPPCPWDPTTRHPWG